MNDEEITNNDLDEEGKRILKHYCEDNFQINVPFLVELKFKKPNNKTALEILGSLSSGEEFLPDVKILRVWCCGNSVKDVVREIILKYWRKISYEHQTLGDSIESLWEKHIRELETTEDWEEILNTYY